MAVSPACWLSTHRPRLTPPGCVPRVRWHARRSARRRLDDQDLARPVAGGGEVAVAPTRVGICGSDTHFVLDGTALTRFRPIILGHEACETIAAAGPNMVAPTVGTRVSVIPLVSCYACDQCLRGRTVLCRTSECLGAERHGAWADLVVVPARNVLPVPAGLSDELAAVATDSVATAYHAVKTHGGVDSGSRVVVWGTGGLGLSAVGIAKALGAQNCHRGRSPSRSAGVGAADRR